MSAELITAQVLNDVRAQAVKVSARTGGHVDADELFSVGQLAVVKAAQRFDSIKGDFRAYVSVCMCGAMKDYLRSIDPTSRYVRAAVRLIGNKPSSELTPAERTTLSQVRSMVYVDAQPNGFLDTLVSTADEAETHQHNVSLLLPALLRLPAIEQFVLWQTVVEEHSLEAVGQFLELSAARIQQLRVRGLQLLRTSFNRAEQNENHD